MWIQRLRAQEGAGAAPHVCVVVGGGPARARRLRRPLVGPPRFGWLVPADRRIARSVGLAIEVPHRFHRNRAVRLRYWRITALHPTPRRRFVFEHAAHRLVTDAGHNPPRLRPARACRSRVALEQGAGALDLPHGRAPAPVATFGDPGQGWPFGSSQAQYRISGTCDPPRGWLGR